MIQQKTHQTNQMAQRGPLHVPLDPQPLYRTFDPLAPLNNPLDPIGTLKSPVVP